jgi:serine phosphatase RsbU (regulator of sigma subunit)
LTDLITKNRNETPENLIDIIIKSLKAFAGGQEQSDDITLVIVKRDG